MLPEQLISFPVFLAMGVTLVVCFVVPIVLFVLLRRRHERMAGPMIAGALAFYISQILLRLPLLQYGLPQLEKLGVDVTPNFLYLLGLSLSAGLFEETARLAAFKWLLRDRRTWAVGVSFGIGHGGIEAILLIGATYINNLVLAVMYNRGTLDAFLADKLPAESITQLVAGLTGTSATLFLAAGLERALTMCVHIALSLVVLQGIVRARQGLGWLLAVLLHGAVNLIATGIVQLGLNVWWSEVALLIMAIGAVIWILKAKSRFPSDGTDKDEAETALKEGY